MKIQFFTTLAFLVPLSASRAETLRDHTTIPTLDVSATSTHVEATSVLKCPDPLEGHSLSQSQLYSVLAEVTREKVCSYLRENCVSDQDIQKILLAARFDVQWPILLGLRNKPSEKDLCDYLNEREKGIDLFAAVS